MVRALVFWKGAILMFPIPFMLSALSVTVSHSLTQFFPKMCCSQQLLKLDACDSSKNFYNLTAWMMSPVQPWNYEELTWEWLEQIVFGPEM